jgi:UDP:flavonoid glycosyltransferase YjiC (YdhE family)
LVKKINPPVVLVAPLDWGLGHATRCIPVIHLLQQNGYKVIIAAEGRQAQLLQQEFPALQILFLQGYRIHYTQYKRLLPLKILWQLPKIMRAVWQEHRWLQRTIREQQVNLVISDNRFGLWSRQATCVFITHQLNIQTPFHWLTTLVRHINYRFINRYSACWVPDLAPTSGNLAGALSHPAVLPETPTWYIGPLTRLQARTAPLQYKWLFVLSGPEPQRTLLEKKLLQVAAQLKEPVFMLRARPGETQVPDAPSNCTVVNHLDSAALEKIFAASEYIVSRSGYTTVMELLAMGKKALLIPTPGQTEQEYLAKHLQQQQWCYSCEQDDDLLAHCRQATMFPYTLPAAFPVSLQEALQQVMLIHS